MYFVAKSRWRRDGSAKSFAGQATPGQTAARQMAELGEDVHP